MWPALERLRLAAVQSLTSHRALRRSSNHSRPGYVPFVGCRQEGSRTPWGLGFSGMLIVSSIEVFNALRYLFTVSRPLHASLRHYVPPMKDAKRGGSPTSGIEITRVPLL